MVKVEAREREKSHSDAWFLNPDSKHINAVIDAKIWFLVEMQRQIMLATIRHFLTCNSKVMHRRSLEDLYRTTGKSSKKRFYSLLYSCARRIPVI